MSLWHISPQHPTTRTCHWAWQWHRWTWPDRLDPYHLCQSLDSPHSHALQWKSVRVNITTRFLTCDSLSCRNHRCFCCVFDRIVTFNVLYCWTPVKGRAYALCSYIRCSCFYEAGVSPTFNGSSAIQTQDQNMQPSDFYSNTSLVLRPHPLTRKGVWWPLSDLLVVPNQQSWYWTTQWNSATPCNHVLDRLTDLFVVLCPDPALASHALHKSHD